MKRSHTSNLENIILVSRPINFLYAIEICSLYKEKNFLILLFPHNEELEMKAIDFLYKEFKVYLPNATFKKFSNISGIGSLDLLFFKIYLKVTRRNKKFDILSTSGGVKGRLLFKNLQFNRILITDEGTTSLRRFPEIAKTNILFPEPTRTAYKKLYKFLSVRELQHSNNFSVLTMYNEVLQFDNRISLNKFQNLKKIVDKRGYSSNKNEVIILGTHPRVLGLEESEYIKLIDNLVKEYKDYKVFLKPHKNYNNAFHFHRLETGFPIEYFFLERKEVPQFLFSFGSTANKLLGYLFPEIIIKNLVIEKESHNDSCPDEE